MIIKYINKQETEINLKSLDTENFSSISQIYSFTTENISGYFKYIDFENKSILTVSGSGDHIINAIYCGAKNVVGFDINYLALIFTELKLVALENLEYEEFLNYFLINEKSDINKNKNALNYEIYLNKLEKDLSHKAKECMKLLYKILIMMDML